MIRESAAILLVGALLLLAFARTKHYGYVLGTAPLFIIPLIHLIIRGVLYLSKEHFFGFRPAIVMAFADVLALALTCVFIVLISQRIESKRNKRLYLAVMLTYSILLGWAYVFNSLQVLLG